MNGAKTFAAAAAVVALLAATHSNAQGSPRIAPLPESEWSDELRPVAEAFAATGMRNLAATYANSTEVATASLPHLAYIWGESTLAPRERALLALRTAWVTRSEYLWAHRAALARREGLTAAEIEQIARGPDVGDWSGFDYLLLRAADEMHVDSIISDATWAGLAERYDTAQMIDTIDTVGAITMHAGAANSLRVELEADVRGRLPNVPYRVAAERTNRRLVDKAPRIPPRAPEGGGPIAANVFSTFNHNPAADRVRGAINTLVNNRMTLDPRHRELLLIRIGINCRSEYEYAAHVRVGLRVGLTDADIETILAGPDAAESSDPLFVPLMRATDELWEDDRVTDPTWDALSAALSPGQMLEVLFAVGGYRSTSILINSAGVQLDANMADFRFPPELR